MKKSISRRQFLKSSLVAGAAMSSPFILTGCGADLSQPGSGGNGIGIDRASSVAPPKVLLLTIDSLDPRYLYLDADGQSGGCQGNWLMPNVRAFLDGGTWFADTRCNMPAATDMNHLNAVAGTNTGETGINLVSIQLFDWESDGTPILTPTSLSFARDGNGRSVDTLFNAWKRRWPESKTFYVSGKEWVANMFNTPGSGVDIFISGGKHPTYINPPAPGYKFYDPPTDKDASNDAESRSQILFSLIAYQNNPQGFPPDMWTVDASLAMLDRERPDFGVILLAQMDDLQHGLGAGHDPDEFEWVLNPLKGKVAASKYNHIAYREAILDGVRDVDFQFGRLVQNIRSMPSYKDAVIVLYSDHGHLTHRGTDKLPEVIAKSAFGIQDYFTNTNFLYILKKNGLLSDDELKFKGFCPIMASSVGVMHFAGNSMEERIQKAQGVKQAMLSHRVWNKFTWKWDCPWDVIGIEDMKQGVAGVCDPGELYHAYYAYKNEPGVLHWPDLFLFARDHWQLPVIAGYAANIGMQIPEAFAKWLAPVNLMIGGHGSSDTQDIVMGFSGPGIASGRVVTDPNHTQDFRISDIAITLASILGLDLQSNTVGRDISSELG